MKDKILTMDDLYGDDSNHLACDKCGLCIRCKDCICPDNSEKKINYVLV